MNSSVSSVQIPPASKSFQEAQCELNQTAAELNQSAGDVVHASRGSSSQLAVASGKFSEDFDEFLDAGIEMAGHTQVGIVFRKGSNSEFFIQLRQQKHFSKAYVHVDVGLMMFCVILEKGRPGAGDW